MLSLDRDVPAEALDFVPGEFGLQLSMCQGNHPEALPGVGLQGVGETLWDWREKQSHVSLTVFYMSEDSVSQAGRDTEIYRQ